MGNGIKTNGSLPKIPSDRLNHNGKEIFIESSPPGKLKQYFRDQEIKEYLNKWAGYQQNAPQSSQAIAQQQNTKISQNSIQNQLNAYAQNAGQQAQGKKP